MKRKAAVLPDISVANQPRERGSGVRVSLPKPLTFDESRYVRPPTAKELQSARPWMERRSGQCAWPFVVGGETLSCCQPVHCTADERASAYCVKHTLRMYPSRDF